GSVYEIDVDALRAARPDLVLTQGVCEVCAVPTGSVDQAVAALEWTPRVLSLDAHTLEQIFATMRDVADAAGQPARGGDAVGRLRARVERVRAAVAGRERPRVLALEWLDPPFAPGHWVPEMVETAGGDNLLGTAGSHSREIPWERARELDPDRLLLVPCGYPLERARQDADEARGRLLALAPRAVAGGGAAVGHSAYFSRSGPRVVEGIEALARWLHPAAGVEGGSRGILEPWR
ncbi:MAG TPA: ABC transporter substrate-binding protein, partial [Longimicrobium sp.]|nr:ABC transporter substrate-binding protein [Longimicrobium sp.]